MRDETLAEVVGTGHRRESLEAIRDRLAVLLAQSGARDGAPLAKQLSDVMQELEQIQDEAKESVVDDLAAARAARRQAAAGL